VVERSSSGGGDSPSGTAETMMAETERFPMPPDYLGYDVEVVSPELPCGASWLANCLLELKVPLWNPWGFDTRAEWERLGPYRYHYAAEKLPWRQTLPALAVGREFMFAARPAPRFSHRWPAELDATRPIILFVRDPRDALYSEWRRQLRNGGPAATAKFQVFLRSPYYHHPFSFAEYLRLFLRSCRDVLATRNSLLVRFEDYRAVPQQTLRRVVQFLGSSATEAELATATARSDFSVLRRIESELEAGGESHRQFNRRGMAFEYRLSYTPDMHEPLGQQFDEVCQWLGHELV
jgi:Sulfotransferase domain